MNGHRRTGEERRQAIVEAALTEFAAAGFKGATVDAIAREVGISQPYVFRLFSTKLALFVAVIDEAGQRTLERFERVGLQAGGEEDPLRAMGRACFELLSGDRRLVLVQLHALAACDHPSVREAVWRNLDRTYHRVAQLANASPEELSRFFANGMLLIAAAAIDIPAAQQPWARSILEAGTPPR